MQKYLQKQARTPQSQQDKDKAPADEDQQKQQAMQEPANKEASQQPHHQKPHNQQTGEQTQSTKPTATKAKPPTRNTEACQQPAHSLPPPQESSSSSSHDVTASHAHHHTHFVTILGHEPPLHCSPARLTCAERLTELPSEGPSQHTTTTTTHEELQLSYQIAQALTTQIRRITARILQTHAVGQTHSTHHHNDVITLDSQESETPAEPDTLPQQEANQQQ